MRTSRGHCSALPGLFSQCYHVIPNHGAFSRQQPRAAEIALLGSSPIHALVRLTFGHIEHPPVARDSCMASCIIHIAPPLPSMASLRLVFRRPRIKNTAQQVHPFLQLQRQALTRVLPFPANNFLESPPQVLDSQEGLPTRLRCFGTLSSPCVVHQ